MNTMRKSDWLEVGLKILGAYFLVLGLDQLWRTLLTLLFTGGAAHASVSAVAVLFPALELLAGVVLLLLKRPLQGRRARLPVPDGLEDAEDPAGKSETPFWQPKHERER